MGSIVGMERQGVVSGDGETELVGTALGQGRVFPFNGDVERLVEVKLGEGMLPVFDEDLGELWLLLEQRLHGSRVG